MEKPAVLVTGASSGIGRETVLLLAARGFQVFAGVRKAADGAALSKAARAALAGTRPAASSAAGGSLEPVIIDVTRASSIASALRAVGKAIKPGASFSLVNNAGIAVAAPLELLALDDLRRQFEVNVFGQVAVTQAFLPLIRERKGRIVFMGSLFGRIAVPLAGPYSAAKFAVEAVADAFAVELHKWGIRVSLLEPGNVDTPIWEKFMAQGMAATGADARRRQALYKDAEASMHRLAKFFSRGGLTPLRVAEVVHRALTARRPRTRYLVGKDANLLARLTPLGTDRVRYWVIRRILAPR
jgi:NAD(P)-dependent dehydrogenase (short-subunit alcohol dehydrogenase family)